MGTALLGLGYGGAVAAVLLTALFVRSIQRSRGRHFGAAAAVPFLLGAAAVSLLGVVAVALHLVFGWRWPVQCFGVFPTSVALLAPVFWFAHRVVTRR